MRYRANKKVSCQHQQDPHQKQYVPLPFDGGDINPWESILTILV